MIRSVSAAAGGIVIAAGLGGVILTGSAATAVASPDSSRDHSAAADQHSARAAQRSTRPRVVSGAGSVERRTASTRRRSAQSAAATIQTTAPRPARAVGRVGLRSSLGALFNNQTPQLFPTQSGQSPSGAVSGLLNAVDPDSPRLTFTVAGAPSHGTAAVGADGSWTYTPNPPMAVSGGLDSFRVTVSDAASGFAIHGLAGLVHLLSLGLLGARGDSSTATIAVTVTPVAAGNNPPTGVASVSGVDAATGRVDGVVSGQDTDGDLLSYAASVAGKGAVSIDAGTGAFVYLPTDAARQNAAAPSATDADRHDTFTVNITDAHGGSATVGVVVPVSPADQPPPAAGQLLPADLHFEGFFGVPTGQLAAGPYATLAYGGAALASRVVDGQRHFFLTGHRYANDPLVELLAPAALGGTAATAPVAALYRYWGDIYGGRKITAEEPDPTEPNANWTEGLLWDEANQQLLWSYGNWYAALAVNNPVLGATVLAPDGSMSVQGPWRTTSESQQTRSFAVFLSPAVSAATGGATLGLGGKMQSINATASWGPALHVIGSAAGNPRTPIDARVLASHPISPAGRRTLRVADYEVARNPDGSPDSAGTEPAVDGVGFWTELDETTGAAFVHTGSGGRSALVYAGGQASGLIWYGPDLEHGVTDGRGYNGSGNHAGNYRPVLWLVSEDDLVAAAEGRLDPDQVNPYATIDLMAQFPELGFLNGLSAGQPVFAAEEGRLYVPFAGGSSQGGEPYPLVAVFSVAG